MLGQNFNTLITAFIGMLFFSKAPEWAKYIGNTINLYNLNK